MNGKFIGTPPSSVDRVWDWWVVRTVDPGPEGCGRYTVEPLEVGSPSGPDAPGQTSSSPESPFLRSLSGAETHPLRNTPQGRKGRGGRQRYR